MAALSEEQQIEAGNLYVSGMSTQQIADYFGVGLGAAFYALRHQNIKRRSKAEARRLQYESSSLSYSIKTDLTREEEDLKLAAVMLYWAEGYNIAQSIVMKVKIFMHCIHSGAYYSAYL